MSGRSRPKEPVELGPEAQTLVAAYEEAKRAREAWDERVEKLRQEVINLLGPADVGTVQDRPVVRYSKVESRVVNGAALRESYPEVYDQVAKVRTTWRLTTSLGSRE